MHAHSEQYLKLVLTSELRNQIALGTNKSQTLLRVCLPHLLDSFWLQTPLPPPSPSRPLSHALQQED